MEEHERIQGAYTHRLLHIPPAHIPPSQTPKATPGHKPLLHFASELFDSHPRYVQLKSMLMDFFNGEVIDSIHLKGIEHVVSVSLAPTPPTLNAAIATLQASTSTAASKGAPPTPAPAKRPAPRPSSLSAPTMAPRTNKSALLRAAKMASAAVGGSAAKGKPAPTAPRAVRA